jgi:hypothetical protein
MYKYQTPVLFLCSLAAGGFLFFFSPRRLPPAPGRGPSESYAALALAEGVPDQEAAGVLGSILGRPVVSESSQWVFLNSFEGMEQVPLEDYQGRLEAFDPRRDGYAEKLQRFFVRNGKRWFFIPLDREVLSPLRFPDPQERFKRRINAALDTLPPVLAASGPSPDGREAFFLQMESRGRPAGFWFILFAAAWSAALIFPAGYRRQASRRRPGFRLRLFYGSPAGVPAGRRRLLILTPVMLPLSLWGAPGFAFLTLFLFLGAFLADPLREEWVRLLKRKNPAGIRPQTGPYRFRFLHCLFLILPAAFILGFGGLSPLWGFLNFLALALIYFCSLGIEVCRNFPPPPRGGAASGAAEGGGRYSPCRFAPLPILPRRRSGLAPPAGAESHKSNRAFGAGGWGERGGAAGLVLPFALASCLAALFGSPGRDLHPPRRLPPDWISPVTEEDYRAHALFQAGFALRPLQRPEHGDPQFPAAGYFRYTLGEDGLVEGSLPVPEETAGWEIPPFPLAELSSFLALWESQGASGTGGPEIFLQRPPLGELVSPLLALLLVFPPLAGRGRGWKGSRPYDDKRIAA